MHKSFHTDVCNCGLGPVLHGEGNPLVVADENRVLIVLAFNLCLHMATH